MYIVPIYPFDTSAPRRVACGGEAKGGWGISKLYDTIEATYTVTRGTGPRIAAQVWAALGEHDVDFTTAAGVAAENAERR